MRRPTPPPICQIPYDGNPRTVDELLARLCTIDTERSAIIDELRRQRSRADEAIRKAENQ